MSVSLSAERDRIQRQVYELQQSLSATHAELEELSSETDDESDGDVTEEEARQCAAGLLAQREKIQQEIQNLETILGPHSPVYVSDSGSSSSDESELSLSLSVDSCLQMNLVYQQVIQETLEQLETLLTNNHRQQKEVMSQLSGPIKESSREQGPPSGCQQPVNMFLGRFLKPYFKDKVTGLGPPANQEAREKASRMTGCLDEKKLKLKRWESWQKTLLIHSVAKDGLRKLIQPKLSKVDYLSRQMLSAGETDRQQLRQQIDSLEKEVDLLREKKEEELIGDRFEDHDWQRICNVDFEGLREAEDICRFWQNFLHPSVNKSRWSQEEVQQLKEVSRRHGEKDWESIAKELGTGRTAFLCLQTFQRFVSDSLKRSSWTPAEDDLLRELVDKMRIGNFIPYTQMSYFMEGRDPAQLIYRWNQVLDPSLKKGPWTKEEDQLLLQAVSRHGEKDWWKIRLEVPGRTDGGCRDRYYDCLKVDRKKGGFDQQEQQLLLQLVKKHGVGRWAKIAAEIPRRNDAQVLREWRKLTKPAQSKDIKPRMSRGGAKAKKVSPAKKRIKRRLKKLKEETSEEEEEMVVEYMDSDEEKKKKKEIRNRGRRKESKEEKKKTKEVVEVSRIEEGEEEVGKEIEKEVEKEEEEEEYTFPPMKEWAPAEKPQCSTSLNFRPVEFPSSGDALIGKCVRSTILGEFGRSVIIAPEPREVPWEQRHCSTTMMMVSPNQLQVHLQHEANKLNGPKGTCRRLGRGSDRGLELELQAALMPWIGNVLITVKTRPMAADVLREQGENKQLSSTSIFLLFLQTMNVDSAGCKEMIECRDKLALWTPPPDPSFIQIKNPNTIAGMLQQRRIKEELQEFELQYSRIMSQLQALQQHTQQQLPPRLPSLSPNNHPGIRVQMPPKIPPQMSCPPAVFIPQLPHTASILTPPPRPSAAPSSPHGLKALPVSVHPLPLTAMSTCSASFQQAELLTQNPKFELPSCPKIRLSIGPKKACLLTGHNKSNHPVTNPRQPRPAPSPSSSIQKPRRGRQKKVAEDLQAVGSSQNQVALGGAVNGVGGASSDLDGAADDSMIEDGRRTHRLSLKAKSLQEATKAKAEAMKKEAPTPRRARIRTTIPPPQTGDPDPPQQVCAPLVELEPQTPERPEPPVVASSPLTRTEPPKKPDVPPVSVSSTLPQNAVPASDQTVSSTQNPSSAPPPSMPTNQHTSSLPAFQDDHDYTFLNQNASGSIQSSPARKKLKSRHRKSNSTPRQPHKAPPTGRKQGREEEPRVTGSRDEQGVGGAGEGVGGACKEIGGADEGVGGAGESVGGAGEGVGGAGEGVGGASKEIGGAGEGVGGAGEGVGGAGEGVTPEGKRVRKPSQRARALQEATQAQAEAKKRRASSSPRRKHSRTSRSQQEVLGQDQVDPQPPGANCSPGRPVLVMSPGAMDPPRVVPLALVPMVPMVPAPLRTVLIQSSSSPLQSLPKPPPGGVLLNLPQLAPPRPLLAPPPYPSKLLPPAAILGPVPNLSAPKPPANIFLPYKCVARVDSAAPPPLRREALQFDPSLMFLEPQVEVCDWLSGRGGVAVPGAGVALPYLPPFVSSLSTLSALLRTQKSLTKSSQLLLSRGSEPRHPLPRPRPEARPNSSPKTTSSREPDLPDSTSDLKAAEDQPAPSVNRDHPQEEAELVAAVRQLVAERFSGNPAYQLLKARFLSCFTVPALLATVMPIKEKCQPRPDHEEEEEEEEEQEQEEEELKKIKERGKQRRVQKSLLLRAGSGAPANHYSGIINVNDQTEPAGPSRSRPGQ